MKRLFAVVVLICVLLSLVACDDNKYSAIVLVYYSGEYDHYEVSVSKEGEGPFSVVGNSSSCPGFQLSPGTWNVLVTVYDSGNNVVATGTGSLTVTDDSDHLNHTMVFPTAVTQ